MLDVDASCTRRCRLRAAPECPASASDGANPARWYARARRPAARAGARASAASRSNSVSVRAAIARPRVAAERSSPSSNAFGLGRGRASRRGRPRRRCLARAAARAAASIANVFPTPGRRAEEDLAAGRDAGAPRRPRTRASSSSGSAGRRSLRELLRPLQRIRIERQVELQHVDRAARRRSPMSRPCVCCATSARTLASGNAARFCDARELVSAAAAGLMCGSSPLAEAVTRSTGTGALVARVRGAQRFDARLHRVGERRIERALVRSARGAGVVGHRRVADGRPQKYFGSRTAGRSARSPTALPSCARSGSRSPARAKRDAARCR